MSPKGGDAGVINKITLNRTNELRPLYQICEPRQEFLKNISKFFLFLILIYSPQNQTFVSQGFDPKKRHRSAVLLLLQAK